MDQMDDVLLDTEHSTINYYGNHNDHDQDYEEAAMKRKEKRRNRIHIAYTAALYFCFISVGLCYSIFNPTLVQLATIFDSDLRHVSMIFPSRSIGSTVGTLTIGFLTLYINRQTLLFSFLILKSLTTFLVPHWTSVQQFCVNGFFNGFFSAAIVVMVNVWLNELWSWSARRRQRRAARHERQRRRRRQTIANATNEAENILDDDQHDDDDDIQSRSTKIDIGNVLMQALHTFFGVGCIMGPILAEPFLRHSYTGGDGFLSNCLVLPYTIASSTAILSSLSFFILYLAFPYDQPSKREKSDEPDHRDHHHLDHDHNSTSHFRYLIVFVCATFLFVFLGSEGTYFQFSASFATKIALHLSESNAALLASSLAISFTIARAFSILIALKLTPGVMIALDLLTVLAGNTLIYVFADRNLAPLIAGIVLLGAGFASVFPSFFPFLERHGFEVTDMIGSVLTFAGGLAEVLAPFAVGYFIDTRPYALVYFTFVSLACSAIVLLVLNMLISRHHRSQASRAHQDTVIHSTND